MFNLFKNYTIDFLNDPFFPTPTLLQKIILIPQIIYSFITNYHQIKKDYEK